MVSYTEHRAATHSRQRDESQVYCYKQTGYKVTNSATDLITRARIEMELTSVLDCAHREVSLILSSIDRKQETPLGKDFHLDCQHRA